MASFTILKVNTTPTYQNPPNPSLHDPPNLDPHHSGAVGWVTQEWSGVAWIKVGQGRVSHAGVGWGSRDVVGWVKVGVGGVGVGGLCMGRVMPLYDTPIPPHKSTFSWVDHMVSLWVDKYRSHCAYMIGTIHRRRHTTIHDCITGI